jgi:hypothetical protein
MNPNTHIQLKQKSHLAADGCGVGAQKSHLAAGGCGVGARKSRVVAQAYGIGTDMQPKQNGHAMGRSGGLTMPARRVGMDFGSTD